MKAGRLSLVAFFVLTPSLALAQPVFETSERRITTDPGEDFDPAISGDLVVYTSFRGKPDTDVYYTNLATGQEVQVTDAVGYQELTDAATPLIAYVDRTAFDVYVYSTISGTATNIAPAADYRSTSPALSNELVAWQETRDRNLEIYGKDLATGIERRITSSANADTNPSVSGKRVVWESCSLGVCDILSYDWDTGATKAITATPAGDERRPDIDGNIVVYESLRAGEKDIYAYDLATGIETRLSLPGSQTNANVSGDFVALEDFSSGVYHILVWHLPSNQTYLATSGPGGQYLNDISGNRIAFTDDRNGQLDIYVLDFSLTLPPSGEITCADPKGAPALIDQVLMRSTGKPNWYELAFSARPGPGLVCIDNGVEGAPKISAAAIGLNNGALVVPEQWIDGETVVESFELEAELVAGNILTARIASRPGAAIRLRVYALPNPAPVARMGVQYKLADPVVQRLLRGEVIDTPRRDDLGMLRQGLEDSELAFGCSQSGGGATFVGAALLGLLALGLRPRRAQVPVRK